MLVDSGPLVAVIDRTDPWHDRCVEFLRSIPRPPITVWPALSEAMHLMSDSWEAQAQLWERILDKTLLLAALDESDSPRMRDLMEKYRDLPMDLADAALVRVAERAKIRKVFTLDRRDFQIYRPAGIGRFEIVP